MRGTTQKKQQQQKNTLGIVTCANGSIEQKQETDRQTDGHWRPLLLGVTLTTSSNVCWWYRCQWTSAITLDFTCGLQFLCIYFFRKIFWNCFVPRAEASRSDVIHIRLWLFFLSQSFFSLLNFHFNLLNRKTNQQTNQQKKNLTTTTDMFLQPSRHCCYQDIQVHLKAFFVSDTLEL